MKDDHDHDEELDEEGFLPNQSSANTTPTNGSYSTTNNNYKKEEGDEEEMYQDEDGEDGEDERSFFPNEDNKIIKSNTEDSANSNISLTDLPHCDTLKQSNVSTKRRGSGVESDS